MLSLSTQRFLLRFTLKRKTLLHQEFAPLAYLSEFTTNEEGALKEIVSHTD